MSATIYWNPVQVKSSYLSIGSPSTFQEIMRNVFGDVHGLCLGEKDVKTLEAMKHATSNAEYAEAFETMADAIAKYGEIVLSVQY